ncbi:MAG: hypothetical protein WCJ18_06040 [Planctomycetota bacterium]
MPREPDVSPIGEALVWASRIMSIGLTMFVPGVIGGWLDHRLGLNFLAPVGLLIGFGTAILWLVQLGRAGAAGRGPGRPTNDRRR